MLDAVDIVDLVGDCVALKAKGREYVCLCPFHDDRNPSMYVVPHKQIYHCFVCGAGGNAIDFAMKYHGMGFREALELLAQKGGIELTPMSPPTAHRRRDGDGVPDHPGVGRDEIARANAFAQDFFRTVLRHPEHGAVARALIERRGISAQMVEAFGVGAAPARWDGLVQTARSKDVPVEWLLAAGLVKAREREGGHYDALRNRLTFPILDQARRAIAFGGRRLDDDDEPKYLNSPETALFVKGATLYGLPQATRAIRETRRVIVTEGYTDVVACHQHGVENVVATLGTALTERHARLVRRLADEVILLFDGDEAGQRAADRAFEVFFPEALDVRVAALPGGRDPDEVLKEEGGDEAFARMLEEAEDVLEHRVRRLERELNASGRGVGSAGRSRVVEEMVGRLADLGLDNLPPIRRRSILDRLARLAGVDARTVAEAAQRTGRRRPGRADEEAGAEEPARIIRPATTAEHALACLLARPDLAKRAGDDARFVLDPGGFGRPAAALVAREALALVDAGVGCGVSELLGRLEESAAREAAVTLSAHVDRWTDEAIEAHWQECVRRLRLARGVLPTARDDAAGESADADPLSAALEARRTLGQNVAGLPRVRGGGAGNGGGS